MKIVVHIDRLVLDGVGQPDLPRLQAALEQELARALRSDSPTFGQRREAAAEPDAPIDVSHGPEAIGQAIARAAHARITAAHTAASTAASSALAAGIQAPLSAEPTP